MCVNHIGRCTALALGCDGGERERERKGGRERERERERDKERGRGGRVIMLCQKEWAFKACERNKYQDAGRSEGEVAGR